MSWPSNLVVDALGWGGSALLVYSLLQVNVLRLRILNLVACLILIVFNTLVGVWPMVGMNVVLSLINAWFIVRSRQERHDATAFEVLEVSPSDAYLQHFLRVHETDIATYNPRFVHDPAGVGQSCFLVQRRDETVGVVSLRTTGDTAHVLLDYVTPRFRDLSPGEFVWRRSQLLAERQVHTVITPPGMVDAYYGRLGFSPQPDGSWALTVPT